LNFKKDLPLLAKSSIMSKIIQKRLFKKQGVTEPNIGENVKDWS